MIRPVFRLEGRGSFSCFLTSIPEGFFSSASTGTERISVCFRLSANKFQISGSSCENPQLNLSYLSNVPYRPTSAQDDIDQPIIDAGGVLEIPFITEEMARNSLNKLTSTQYQKKQQNLTENDSEANDEHTDFKKVDIKRRKTSESI